MNRLLKVALIGLGVLVLLALAAVVGVNMYVQSPAAQARIQEQLSQALGIPVEITSVTLGWGGLQIAGVRVPSGGRNLLEANSFSAEYRLLPLLNRQLAIRRMVLDSPRVLWAQNEKGQWVLPLLPEHGRKKDTKLENAPAPDTKPTPAPRSTGFAVTLDTLEIHNGSIELLDGEQRRVALATEVNMRYNLSRKGRVEGTLAAKRIVWQGALTFTDVQSPFRYENDELTLTGLQAGLVGGTVTADLVVKTNKPSSPFELKLQGDGLSLSQLAEENGWPMGETSGTVGGTVEFQGELRRVHKAEGKGVLTLKNGRLGQLGLFQTIGQILQIRQLTDLRITDGQADFKVGSEKIFLEPLVLNTTDLTFRSKGTVKFDGKMDLDAELFVSRGVAQQLPSFVLSNFTPPDPAGRQSISFDITGKTSRPKTNLVDRVIGQRITGQVEDLLGSFFGGGGSRDKEKDDKKKNKNRPANEPPAPAPVAPNRPVQPAAPSPANATPAPAANTAPSPVPVQTAPGLREP